MLIHSSECDRPLRRFNIRNDLRRKTFGPEILVGDRARVAPENVVILDLVGIVTAKRLNKRFLGILIGYESVLVEPLWFEFQRNAQMRESHILCQGRARAILFVQALLNENDRAFFSSY